MATLDAAPLTAGPPTADAPRCSPPPVVTTLSDADLQVLRGKRIAVFGSFQASLEGWWVLPVPRHCNRRAWRLPRLTCLMSLPPMSLPPSRPLPAFKQYVVDFLEQPLASVFSEVKYFEVRRAASLLRRRRHRSARGRQALGCAAAAPCTAPHTHAAPCRLKPETAPLAKGFDAVCIFVRAPPHCVLGAAVLVRGGRRVAAARARPPPHPPGQLAAVPRRRAPACTPLPARTLSPSHLCQPTPRRSTTASARACARRCRRAAASTSPCAVPALTRQVVGRARCSAARAAASTSAAGQPYPAYLCPALPHAPSAGGPGGVRSARPPRDARPRL